MSRVISAREVEEAVASGQREIILPPGAVVTPTARDRARELGVSIGGATGHGASGTRLTNGGTPGGSGTGGFHRNGVQQAAPAMPSRSPATEAVSLTGIWRFVRPVTPESAPPSVRAAADTPVVVTPFNEEDLFRTGRVRNLESCIYERRGPLVIITLNRPHRLNAIDSTMHREICAIWDEVNRDPEIRLAIVTAVGDRAFCAGKDIKEYVETYAGGEKRLRPMDDPSSPEYLRSCNRYVVHKPLIGALNGLAVGAGFDLFRMADIRVMADGAWVSALGEQINLPSGFHLAGELPYAVANFVNMTGERLTAQRCLDLGLVTHVVPRAELLNTALTIAAKILSFGPDGIMQLKQRNIEYQIQWGLIYDVETERARIGGRTMQPPPSIIEGHAAFAQKRRPVYDRR